MKPILSILFYSKVILCICISLTISRNSFSQIANYSKSYLNITKGSAGGTIETGDVLEIHATFVVRSGTFDSCAYYDVVPAGTTYVPGTLRILTNEGKVYKQFTDNITDDAGWISGSSIRINLGSNPLSTYATATRRGTVSVADKPAYFSSACIMIASFRVTVNAAAGTSISTGGGSITLKNGINPIQTYTFPPNILRVSVNYGLNTGILGPNMITAETNGTFGGGKPRNRASSAYVPASYTYNIFDIGSPHDNFYGISNNTSTLSNYSTLNKWPKPDPSSPSHRVFGTWDIIGDHTGAVSSSAGNPAADTAANSNAGYMLVVNSAYKTDSALQVTISGVCANTLYDISCWLRNICSKCGCDSNGKAATDASGPIFYIPTNTGDSSGVAPNLIFEINGVDYYTTGNIAYTGQWIQKGFSYLTGPLQTSFTLRIFNNSPAGSGNDWALDDITINSVAPAMKYAPGPATMTCKENPITIYDTIRSAAGNYIYYKWQRSTNGGSSWSDVTPASGPAVPYLNGSTWEYITSYTITSAFTALSDSGNLYRALVSGTASGLSGISCSFTSGYYTLRVVDCGIPLKLTLLSFSGILRNGHATLNWITTGEDEPLRFDIEKSSNNSAFPAIHTINGNNEGIDAVNNYSWSDPETVNGKIFYRLKIYNNEGNIKYSQVLALTNKNDVFDLVFIENPFEDMLLFTVHSDRSRVINTRLLDISGRPVKSKSVTLVKGANSVRVNNLPSLPAGVYILVIDSNGEMIRRKLLKR